MLLLHFEDRLKTSNFLDAEEVPDVNFLILRALVAASAQENSPKSSTIRDFNATLVSFRFQRLKKWPRFLRGMFLIYRLATQQFLFTVVGGRES